MSAGCTRHFQFVLGNYAEEFNHTQFGLLRKDLTPRPAYVALAAVGRLLAGAQFDRIWRIDDQPHVHAYAFDAWPDGEHRQVIVLWAERPVDWSERNETKATWPLPENPPGEQVYDYLGRPIERPQEIGGSAVFVVRPPRAPADQTPDKPAESFSPPGRASRIVLQIQMPRAVCVKIQPIEWSQGHEYQVPAGQPVPLVCYAYNFSDSAVRGTIDVLDLPAGWTLEPRQWSIRLEAMERGPFEGKLILPADTTEPCPVGTVRLRGDFGPQGTCFLAFAVRTK